MYNIPKNGIGQQKQWLWWNTMKTYAWPPGTGTKSVLIEGKCRKIYFNWLMICILCENANISSSMSYSIANCLFTFCMIFHVKINHFYKFPSFKVPVVFNCMFSVCTTSVIAIYIWRIPPCTFCQVVKFIYAIWSCLEPLGNCVAWYESTWEGRFIRTCRWVSARKT